LSNLELTGRGNGGTIALVFTSATTRKLRAQPCALGTLEANHDTIRANLVLLGTIGAGIPGTTNAGSIFTFAVGLAIGRTRGRLGTVNSRCNNCKEHTREFEKLIHCFGRWIFALIEIM